MTAVLLDTHAWAWSLGGDARLIAATARQEAVSFVSADVVFDGIVARIW